MTHATRKPVKQIVGYAAPESSIPKGVITHKAKRKPRTVTPRCMRCGAGSEWIEGGTYRHGTADQARITPSLARLERAVEQLCRPTIRISWQLAINEVHDAWDAHVATKAKRRPKRARCLRDEGRTK